MFYPPKTPGQALAQLVMVGAMGALCVGWAAVGIPLVILDETVGRAYRKVATPHASR